eukprot:gene25827-31191_t
MLFYNLTILILLVSANWAFCHAPFKRFPYKSRTSPLGERTLLIDNYDSYTYNLFQLIASVSGVEPYVLYNDAFGASWNDVVERSPPFHNIVISPGPGHPSNPMDFGICQDAINYAPVPILGVCLGHQGLVTANGGSVVKAPTPMHGRLSTIYHSNNWIFAGVKNGSSAVRYHSLVAETPLPDELEVTAWTPDGLIMGLQHKTKPHYGVQFHPESIKTSIGWKIIENFINISKNYRSGRRYASPPIAPVVPAHSRKYTPQSPLAIPSSFSLGNEAEKRAYVYSFDASAYSVSVIDVFDRLFGNVTTSFFLDSECAGPEASYPAPSAKGSGMSIMGAPNSRGSYVVDYSHSGQLTKKRYDERTGGLDNGTVVNASLLEFIRQEVSKQPAIKVYMDDKLCGNDALSKLNGLIHGGMFGYLSYEMGLEVEDLLSSTPTKCRDKRTNKKLPLGFFIVPSVFIAYNHDSKVFYAVGVEIDDCDYSTSVSDSGSCAKRLLQAVKEIMKSSGSIDGHSLLSENSNNKGNTLVAWKGKKAYKNDIKECLRHITNGDTYEVCLTMQFHGKFNAIRSNKKCPALATYQRLRRFNPAPYACFIKNNYKDDPLAGFAICCSSPERYLKIEQDGSISSKPIKGTARRDLDNLAHDVAIAEKLHSDEKSQAENLMITDLVRNDLGRVCEIGSVHVPSLMSIESYATVHQMVSTITGKLRADKDVVDAIVATFPGGSMTGAPKLRTMQIIRSLEPFPRGIYAGSIGYISLTGSMDMNIVIRTAVLQGENITIGAGGAIVALSDPDEEIEEVMLK